MKTATISRHVTRNPEILSGEPIIVGTRTPVRAIVENWRLGVRPEEIPLPDELVHPLIKARLNQSFLIP